MPPDFYLIVAAVLIAFGSRRFFHAVAAKDERRRRRQLGALPLGRIADATPGARVKIGGTVERTVTDGRGRAFVVRDDSGAALVYPASAAALLPDGQALRDVSFAAGDAVTVIGVPRPSDPRLDGEAGGLVFAGAEAFPLYIVGQPGIGPKAPRS